VEQQTYSYAFPAFAGVYCAKGLGQMSWSGWLVTWREVRPSHH